MEGNLKSKGIAERSSAQQSNGRARRGVVTHGKGSAERSPAKARRGVAQQRHGGVWQRYGKDPVKKSLLLGKGENL